ncbi:MAG TPA: hypothetical protein VKB34_08805 [Povalibacter sp.]|nr:hypothetical protein [Povalibacter sp.]
MSVQKHFSGDRMTHLRHFFCMAVIAMLGACGSESDTGAQNTAPAAKTVEQPKAAAQPVDPVAQMPRAVGNGKPGAAVDIKYEFSGRPEVGKPVQLEIALIPSAGVDSLEATFSGMDGFTLTGDLTTTISNARAGEPYKHSLSVQANRSGVFYVTVSVNTQISGVTLGRTFAVPFLAGTATAVQDKPAPATDATGQAVQPMKAQETH